MTSMIERVARAMDPMSAKIADMLISKGMARSDVLGILPMEKARAAIEAMRGPSPAMVAAVSANWGRRTWLEYDALIDAALHENT